MPSSLVISAVGLMLVFAPVGSDLSPQPDVRDIIFDPNRSPQERGLAVKSYICSNRSCQFQEALVVNATVSDGATLDIEIRVNAPGKQSQGLPWTCSVTHALMGCNFEMLPLLEELRSKDGKTIGYAGVYEGRPNCDWSKQWTPDQVCPRQ
jgi:hypothetical protein